MTSTTEKAIKSSPVTPAIPERRKAKRFPCQGTGEVIVLGGALHFTGELQDVSASGCRMVTEVAFTLERGTQVEVVLVVDNVHFRVAAGVRANSKTRGVGLEFMNLSARCKRLILDLVQELEAKAGRERAGMTPKPDAPSPGDLALPTARTAD